MELGDGAQLLIIPDIEEIFREAPRDKFRNPNGRR